MTEETYRGFRIIVTDDRQAIIKNGYTVSMFKGGVEMARSSVDGMVDRPTEKQRRKFVRRFNKLAGF